MYLAIPVMAAARIVWKRVRHHRKTNQWLLFPTTGYTTDDLAGFYRKIASVLLPHLVHRPVTLKRFPDDIHGESFWEKDLPAFAPKWIKTFSVPRVNEPTDIHYIDMADAKTLVWAAEMGCVEIHPFLHCYPEIHRPTSIVFDLDPGPPANIIDCCHVALMVRDFLAKYGLKTLVKASGSNGLQLYIPLNTRTSYAITQPFAKRVAEVMAGRNPELILSEMARDLRPGKVFIDWSQNAWHKMTAGVYSVRAKRERPFVSMPLKWKEVQVALDSGEDGPLYVEPEEAISRVEQMGDLFHPVLQLTQELPDKLLREWEIDTTIPSESARPIRSRKRKAAPGLPRSSGQGGRRLFVIHRILWADWEYELAIEEKSEFICWEMGFDLPLTDDAEVVAKQSYTENLRYLTFETHNNLVWDLGTYEIVEGSLKKGAVRIYLSGQKVEGELSVSKLDDKKWRVLNSGLALKEGAPSDESALTPADVPGKRSNPKPTINAQSSVERAIDVAGLPKAEPVFIRPMDCTEVRSPEQLPHDPAQWMYEVKWDGFRCEVVKRNGEVQMFTRRGNEPNARYKHITEAAASSTLADCVLDGEVVALNRDGVPEFQLLQNSRHNDAPVVFVAFDALNYDGGDLTGVPLEKRKELLLSLRPILPATSFLLSEPLEGDLSEIVTVLEQRGLEGVVVKRRSSLYHAGKDKFEGWVKYRIGEVDEFVIGGYMRRSDPALDALVVGQYEGRKLIYKEKIRFGFEGVDKRAILKMLQPLRTPRCPFDNLPQRKRRGALDEAQMRECTWVRPGLLCEMEFPEWTNTGEIRGHGKFRKMIGRKQEAA